MYVIMRKKAEVMKKNELKRKEIQMKDTSYAVIAIKKTTYSGFNFEVFAKNGTSNNGFYFHDYTMALKKFEELVKEFEKYELKK